MILFQIFLRIFTIVSLPFLLVVPAQAIGDYTSPAYYQVFNVAPGGTLKVRSMAKPGASVIGEYISGAGPIEVIRVEGDWGYVIYGEGNGWVNMAHLNVISVLTVGESDLPQGLVCSGTEPFWSLVLSADELVYSRMGEGEETYSIIQADGFDGRTGPDGFVQASGATQLLNAVVSARLCSDGMSDRNYGWWVNLLTTSASGTSAQTGCCSVWVQ